MLSTVARAPGQKTKKNVIAVKGETEINDCAVL